MSKPKPKSMKDLPKDESKFLLVTANDEYVSVYFSKHCMKYIFPRFMIRTALCYEEISDDYIGWLPLPTGDPAPPSAGVWVPLTERMPEKVDWKDYVF